MTKDQFERALALKHKISHINQLMSWWKTVIEPIDPNGFTNMNEFPEEFRKKWYSEGIELLEIRKHVFEREFEVL